MRLHGMARCIAALASGVVLAVLIVPPVAGASLDEAYRLYKRAESKLDAGAYDEALALINDALEQSESSGAFRVGIQQRSYYPHYLRGLVHLRLGDAAAARGDFATELGKGEIQKDAALHGRLVTALTEAEAVDVEAPLVRIEGAELEEFLAVERDGRAAEDVRVRLQGLAIDTQSGIRSISVGGRELALTSAEGAQRFDEVVTVAADATTVRIVAVDSAGNVGESEHRLSIPPLDLGPAARRIHAVVVGVNAYDKSYRTELGDCKSEIRSTCEADRDFACYSIPDLSYAAADARNFSDLLLRRGVPRENVQLLVSDGASLAATRDSVRAALARLEQVEGDRAIFFFSGHGVQSKGQQNLMLLSDTRGWECGAPLGRESTAIEETALGVTEVARAMMQSPIKQRYIILDACRSPRLATKGTDSQQSSPGFSLAGTKGLGLVTVTEPEDRGLEPIIFYSTLEKKVSIEWNRNQSGYFTYFLLQGLRRDLPLDALKTYVQHNVKEQTIQDLCSADPAGASCPYVQAPYLQLPDALENDYALQSRTFILGRGEQGGTQ